MYRKESRNNVFTPAHSIGANESEHVARAQELSAKHGLMLFFEEDLTNMLCFLED